MSGDYKKLRVVDVDRGIIPLAGRNQPEINSDPLVGVKLKLQDFMAAVGKGIRGIKFGYMYEDRVSVFMEGHPYTMGWIGFFDHRDTPKERTDHYVVYSHNIANGKYSYSQQHYMAASVNIATAVKNAKTYLRNYTPTQLAYEEYRSVQDGHSDIGYAQSRRVTDAKFSIKDHAYFLHEMQNLVATGHEFVNPEFASHVHEYVTAQEEDRHIRKNAAVFVRHYERLGEDTFDVVEVPSVIEGKYKIKQMDTTTYTNDDLPKHIMDGIAVLQILPEENKDRRKGTRGTYVEGVGHKVGDNMYFVLV